MDIRVLKIGEDLIPGRREICQLLFFVKYFAFSETLKYYEGLNRNLKLELLKIYRYDFEMFGYDWELYFQDKK